MRDNLKKLTLFTCLIPALLMMTGIPAAADVHQELVVGVQKNPPTLEPLRENSNMAMRIVFNVFDTLIDYEFPSFKLVPGLAISWQRLDDRTLEFKLRRGVRFHNGDEFSAKDVAFTFGETRLFDEKKPGYGNARMYFGGIERIDIIDDYTVRIRAKNPDPVLEHRFASYMGQILSKKDFEDAADYNQFSIAPAGTGPYRIVANKVDDYIALAAFEDSWRGQPPAGKITFKVVDEVAARVAGLVSGEYDIITELPPDQFNIIESKSHVEVVGGPIRNNRVIVYNTSDPVMADVNLRKALNYAIDRQLIADSLYRGATQVPRGNQFEYYGDMFIEDWEGHPYNPQKARQFLAQSNYKGQPLLYRLLPGYYTFQAATAQILQQMWKEVGINVQLEFVENWSQVLKNPRGITQIQDYSSTMMYPDPVGHLWRLWGENGVYDNYDFWSNPEFNKHGRILASSNDLNKRRAAFRSMLEILQNQDPSGTYLHQLVMYYGKSKRLNWQPSVVEYMNFRPDGLQFLSANN